MALQHGDRTILPPGDWALWGLLCTSNFRIYRMWPKEEKAREVFDYFTSYMTARLNDVAEHGYWPHYRLQAAHSGIPFNEFTTDLSLLEPPRQMIQEWRVTCVDSIPVQARPERWAGFEILDIYPDVRTKAFALRVEAERRTGIERALLPAARITSDGILMCASREVAATDSQPVTSNYHPTDAGSLRSRNWGVNPMTPRNINGIHHGKGSIKTGARSGKGKLRKNGKRQEPAKS
jgi:hypothetical protein